LVSDVFFSHFGFFFFFFFFLAMQISLFQKRCIFIFHYSLKHVANVPPLFFTATLTPMPGGPAPPLKPHSNMVAFCFSDIPSIYLLHGLPLASYMVMFSFSDILSIYLLHGLPLASYMVMFSFSDILSIYLLQGLPLAS